MGHNKMLRIFELYLLKTDSHVKNALLATCVYYSGGENGERLRSKRNSSPIKVYFRRALHALRLRGYGSCFHSVFMHVLLLLHRQQHRKACRRGTLRGCADRAGTPEQQKMPSHGKHSAPDLYYD